MSNDTALITGVSGFTGRHLVDLLTRTTPDLRLVGTDRVSPEWELPCRFIQADLVVCDDVRWLLTEVRPRLVFHLAACHSVDEAPALYEVNVVGTVNLLEGIRNSRSNSFSRVLIPGSAAEYGIVDEADNPIPETHPARPVTHYGLSKHLQSEVGGFYFASNGLSVIRTRTFNLTGPGQPPTFFVGSLVEQVRRIQAGQKEDIFEVGNLFPERDFLDVRDAVRAYLLLAEQGMPGEVYNVGSGHAARLQDVVELLLRVCGLEKPVRSVTDRKRSTDVPRMQADTTKLQRLTGWSVSVSLEQSIRDMVRTSGGQDAGS
jgi:GDP-4-dehydro-6-deoxy-D-mannose reductase